MSSPHCAIVTSHFTNLHSVTLLSCKRAVAYDQIHLSLNLINLVLRSCRSSSVNFALIFRGKLCGKFGAIFARTHNLSSWETDFYPMRVLGGIVLALWGCQTPAQYWIKIVQLWVPKFYPVLGLGSGERLLWHFHTPVLYWINFSLRAPTFRGKIRKKVRSSKTAERLRGNTIRGNRTESLWEGHLPLRGSLRGRAFRGFLRLSEVFRGF